PSVWGIELLNEPKPQLFKRKLRRFYRRAYEEICRVGRPGLAVVYHDAFRPRLMSGVLWPYKNFPVYLDHHWYHFSIPRWLQPYVPFWLYYFFLKWKRVILRSVATTQPVLIGEWNGIIGGEKLRRYPKEKHNAIVARHLATQFDIFSEASGWFYWNYKTQDRSVFHFRAMVEDGVITMPNVDSQ